MNKADLERKVRHYETVIEQMQGHTFYCENGDGALVRWYPPRVRSLQDLDAAKRIKAIMSQKEE